MKVSESGEPALSAAEVAAPTVVSVPEHSDAAKAAAARMLGVDMVRLRGDDVTASGSVTGRTSCCRPPPQGDVRMARLVDDMLQQDSLPPQWAAQFDEGNETWSVAHIGVTTGTGPPGSNPRR